MEYLDINEARRQFVKVICSQSLRLFEELGIRTYTSEIKSSRASDIYKQEFMDKAMRQAEEFGLTEGSQ